MPWVAWTCVYLALDLILWKMTSEMIVTHAFAAFRFRPVFPHIGSWRQKWSSHMLLDFNQFSPLMHLDSLYPITTCALLTPCTSTINIAVDSGFGHWNACIFFVFNSIITIWVGKGGGGGGVAWRISADQWIHTNLYVFSMIKSWVLFVYHL